MYEAYCLFSPNEKHLEQTLGNYSDVITYMVNYQNIVPELIVSDRTKNKVIAHFVQGEAVVMTI